MPEVKDSILLSIKQMLGGLDPTYDSSFDTDIIIFINSSLATLTQLGVGPIGGFEISDDQATWQDFIGDDKRLNLVKTFVYLDVRCAFDPPRMSFVLEALKEKRDEQLWRLNHWVDLDGTLTDV